MMEYTKEPWRLKGESLYSGEECIALLEDIKGVDARRIVACVNACAGLKTELLETKDYTIKAELDSLDEQISKRLEAEKHIEELNKYIRQLEANLEGYRA